ncbi:UDP-3-O-(3-hydroxymyristoyl)glucosamine N-acyltransferase [Chitinibacter sp. S2-10]|uniref:UDP-3-O-(3-hydroxymyristoyl)glucosamine N-acyltransferase n=1 Tax=Chitinibacter sp. S2-10 TaxID=3373597 RepID=UPI0039778F23
MSLNDGVYLSDLAEKFSLELIGNNVLIDGVASLQSATNQKICFFSNRKFMPDLLSSQAKAIIAKSADGLPDDRSYLLAANPSLAFAKIAGYFNPLPVSLSTIHPSALISATATLASDVEVGANVVIEDNVQISANVQIKAGSFIGRNTIIGQGTIVMPRVVIYESSIIGEKCIIHAGSVIGSDGFGNAWVEDHWERIPQVGRVVIGDDVEIGANVTIDRGTLDDTLIESGVRLDNLIHIAHNVKLGRNTAIAACCGIAGSAEIGANCLIGGGVLIAGHIKIADGVTILGGSTVPSAISQSGVYASTLPVVPHANWLRNMVSFKKLDELAKKIKGIEKYLNIQRPESGEKV